MSFGGCAIEEKKLDGVGGISAHHHMAISTLQSEKKVLQHRVSKYSSRVETLEDQLRQTMR